jgi:hypothetical protein
MRDNNTYDIAVRYFQFSVVLELQQSGSLYRNSSCSVETNKLHGYCTSLYLLWANLSFYLHNVVSRSWDSPFHSPPGWHQFAHPYHPSYKFKIRNIIPCASNTNGMSVPSTKHWDITVCVNPVSFVCTVICRTTEHIFLQVDMFRKLMIRRWLQSPLFLLIPYEK